MVLMRIYLVKQCIYIYGKGCNKRTIVSAAAVSICSPGGGGGEKQHPQHTSVSVGGGGCLLDEAVRRDGSRVRAEVRFENGRQRRQEFELSTTESKG